MVISEEIERHCALCAKGLWLIRSKGFSELHSGMLVATAAMLRGRTTDRQAISRRRRHHVTMCMPPSQTHLNPSLSRCWVGLKLSAGVAPARTRGTPLTFFLPAHARRHASRTPRICKPASSARGKLDSVGCDSLHPACPLLVAAGHRVHILVGHMLWPSRSSTGVPL